MLHPRDRKLAQWDYGRFLVEYGLTEESVQSMMALQSYHEEEFLLIGKGPSAIHNVGYFAKKQMPAYIVFAAARRLDMPTSAGRFINHAPTALANAVFVLAQNGSLLAVSRRTIMRGEEILVDYRQAARLASWMPPPNPDEVSITNLGMPE